MIKALLFIALLISGLLFLTKSPSLDTIRMKNGIQSDEHLVILLMKPEIAEKYAELALGFTDQDIDHILKNDLTKPKIRFICPDYAQNSRQKGRICIQYGASQDVMELPEVFAIIAASKDSPLINEIKRRTPMVHPIKDFLTSDEEKRGEAKNLNVPFKIPSKDVDARAKLVRKLSFAFIS